MTRKIHYSMIFGLAATAAYVHAFDLEAQGLPAQDALWRARYLNWLAQDARSS